MSDTDELRSKWDGRYTAATGAVAQPNEVLADYAHLLPAHGEALDLACGLGGNALYLARRGLRTWAWDLSPVAVEALTRAATGLPLLAEVRDVIAEPPEPGRFDVVCVGSFLDRTLCPAIAAALKPGGLLYYQTWSLDKVDNSGPGTSDFRLATNELLRLFPGLTVRLYRDEGSIGEVRQGLRNRAQLVAQQPAVQRRMQAS